MKQNKRMVSLMIGGIFLILGILMLAFKAQIAGGKLVDFLRGAGRSSTIIGIVNLVYFIYWMLPSHREEAKEMEEDAEIEAQDELKRLLRNRAASLAFAVALMLTILAVGAFSILHSLEIIAYGDAVSLCLLGLLAAELLVYLIAYACMSRKY